MRATPATPDEHGPDAADGAAGRGPSGAAAPDGPSAPDRRLGVLAAEYQLLLREMLDAAIDQLAWDDAESVTGLTLREHLVLTGGCPVRSRRGWRRWHTASARSRRSPLPTGPAACRSTSWRTSCG